MVIIIAVGSVHHSIFGTMLSQKKVRNLVKAFSMDAIRVWPLCGAKEMSQQVTRLPCKLEDLSSIPNIYEK